MAPPAAIDVQSISDAQVATLSGPLTIKGVPARRAKTPKIGGMHVAHASSDMFKSPVRPDYRLCLSKHSIDRVAGLRQAEGKEVGPYVSPELGGIERSRAD